jgi:predicted ATP-dependent endonuclease of OLD family
LDTFNREFEPSINGGPLNYDNFAGPSRSELFRLLVNHADFMGQSQKVGELLARLGLPQMTIRQAQQVHFNMLRVGVQGSGIRNILPIVAALTDTDLRLVLIDEPETSLEPMLQRRLRDLLVAEASEDRPIVVSTHSHLFLDRGRPSSVISVTNDGTGIRTNVLGKDAELLDVSFRLLGNSTQDLFFPGNFLIAEGASDQLIVEKVMILLDAPVGLVKVLSAGGVERASQMLDAVRRTLVPLVVHDSPYSKRVVVLVDQPREKKTLDGLQRSLDGRLFVLPAESLEDFLPADLYQRAGMNKQTVNDEIARAANYAQRAAIKERVSSAIAHILVQSDLASLGPIHDAALAAIDLAR